MQGRTNHETMETTGEGGLTKLKTGWGERHMVDEIFTFDTDDFARSRRTSITMVPAGRRTIPIWLLTSEHQNLTWPFFRRLLFLKSALEDKASRNGCWLRATNTSLGRAGFWLTPLLVRASILTQASEHSFYKLSLAVHRLLGHTR